MKPDKNLPPERHELPELLDKLKYELWMLGECAKKLAVDDLEEAEHNAWLEAYIIHARLLTEFFRDKPRKDKETFPEPTQTHPGIQHQAVAQIGSRRKKSYALL